MILHFIFYSQFPVSLQLGVNGVAYSNIGYIHFLRRKKIFQNFYVENYELNVRLIVIYIYFFISKASTTQINTFYSEI